MEAILGVCAFLLFSIFAIAQFVAGFVGIEAELGSIWAYIAIFVALGLRFTLPITIGAFFGAMNVWGWHWAAAALFALPGLIFIIPGVLSALLALVKR